MARQVDRQNKRLERLLLDNRVVVQNRSTALAKRLDAIDGTLSRLPFLEQYVEAVAEHGAATSGRLADLLETLEVDPKG